MSEKILKNLKKTRQNQPLCIVSSNSWRRAWYKSHFIGFQGIYCHSKSRDFKGWWRGTLEKNGKNIVMVYMEQSTLKMDFFT